MLYTMLDLLTKAQQTGEITHFSPNQIIKNKNHCTQSSGKQIRKWGQQSFYREYTININHIEPKFESKQDTKHPGPEKPEFSKEFTFLPQQMSADLNNS